jgi:hypothetical protein
MKENFEVLCVHNAAAKFSTVHLFVDTGGGQNNRNRN